MSEYNIGDALNNFLKKSNLRNGIRAVQIEAVWEDIMGKTIARYTEKLQIINQTLFVQTSVGPLKQEIVYQKVKIIQRINEVFGERVISDIVVK